MIRACYRKLDLLEEDDHKKKRLLSLIKRSFPNTRYSDMNFKRFAAYLEFLSVHNGVFYYSGDPTVGCCHARQCCITFGGNRIDAVQIGGMCVDREYRGNGIGANLLRRIESHYEQKGINVFTIFAEKNSPGYFHALKNGYLPYAGWIRCTKAFAFRSITPFSHDSLRNKPPDKGILTHLWDERFLIMTVQLGIFGNEYYMGEDFDDRLHLLSKSRKGFRDLGAIWKWKGTAYCEPTDEFSAVTLHGISKECEFDDSRSMNDHTSDATEITWLGKANGEIQQLHQAIPRIDTF